MLRYLSTLGLTVLAALAIGTVGAAPASAAPEFHFESEHTIITGTQTTGLEWSFDNGTVKCGIANFGGTSQVATTTTITLNPIFENCSIKEGEAEAVAATVTLNGCAFLFHLGANTEHLTGTMGIECPDFPIIIHAPECTITVPQQGNLGTVTYTNEGAETTRSMVFDVGLAGIDYVEHGAGCASETVTTNNGTLSGKITVTGENTMGAHRGIWVQ